MKNREKEVLIELLKNCKISDRQLAQKLNTSQSSITRIRKRLEKNIIRKYTALPDLSVLKIDLASVTFARCTRPKKDVLECLGTLSDKYSRIIFTAEGEGMGKSCMIVTIHKDFTDYTEFTREFRLTCNGFGENIESFLVPTENLLRTLNMATAVEHLVRKG